MTGLRSKCQVSDQNDPSPIIFVVQLYMLHVFENVKVVALGVIVIATPARSRVKEKASIIVFIIVTITIGGGSSFRRR